MKSRLTMIAVAGLLAFSTAACTTNEQRTAGYGVGGAAIGAVAGTLLGAAQTRNGTQYCRYRDPYGRIYEAPCQ